MQIAGLLCMELKHRHSPEKGETCGVFFLYAKKPRKVHPTGDFVPLFNWYPC